MTDRQEQGKKRVYDWIAEMRAHINESLPADATVEHVDLVSQLRVAFAKCSDRELEVVLVTFVSEMVASGVLSSGPGRPMATPPKTHLSSVPKEDSL